MPCGWSKKRGKTQEVWKSQCPLGTENPLSEGGQSPRVDRSRGRDDGFQTESGRPIAFQLPVPLVLPSLTTPYLRQLLRLLDEVTYLETTLWCQVRRFSLPTLEKDIELMSDRDGFFLLLFS